MMPAGSRRTSGKLVTLKQRAEFLRVRGGGRATSPGFVLEGKLRPPPSGGEAAARGEPPVDGPPVNGPRFGFTVTKKIGNAVSRNRIRRRLRAALCELAPQAADPGMDYVVVAREAAKDADFKSLLADLTKAFERVHAAVRKARKARPPGS